MSSGESLPGGTAGSTGSALAPSVGLVMIADAEDQSACPEGIRGAWLGLL